MKERIRHCLNGQWNLCFTVPMEDKIIHTLTSVPGNIEPVLVRLRLIEDYMPADNEYATAKFELVDDWTYTTYFDAEDLHEDWEKQLVFEGIDTIADIYFNQEHICTCNNMHLTYRVDVTKRVKEKDNQLKVVIRSSQIWAREHCHDMFSAAHEDTSYYDSQSYLRKARHQWGWDNAPRLITSGIIRSVYLEELPPERFEEVYLYTAAVKEKFVRIGANWIYHTDKKNLADHKIRLSLLDGENTVYEAVREVRFIQGAFRCEIPRDEIKLWWPNGFGEPYLYTVKMEMLIGREVVSAYEAPFGIRTLTLKRTEDILEDGSGEFVFVVNGEKVFIRGTNWKPLDALSSIADEKTREKKALEELMNLHCNMVRVWGGGIYEDVSFFDYCDQNGIMIWQDFMFACENTPSDEWYCRLVAEEAKQVIKKYRNHPSLAVWCGDNENDQCISWTSSGAKIHPSDSTISRKILKDAVVHHDPYRSYVESSPYASDAHFEERSGNMIHFQPEKHLYPPALLFSKTLRDLKSRFIGETGPIKINAIAVNEETFKRESARLKRLWDAPMSHSTGVHQNDGYFTAWRNAGREVCLAWFGRDFALNEWKDYALAVNLICAELFKDVIEYCRVMRWSKTGVLWWSLIDMWPMLFNYSVIDCKGNRKLPYFWIRQSQQEFALMGVRVENNGELALYAVNDTLMPHTVEYTVTAYDEMCHEKVIASGICSQAANSSGLIQRIAESGMPSLWVIRWREKGKEFSNHVFTQRAEYEVMRSWVRIIGQKGRFEQEILELEEL